ncbi:hypothetical protein L6452_09294 [Arctium lappa]|uniref:Uncharacterized protein n=1 Tax=Arctium lappa TaxID=4217 RepID=A0ACB9DJY7_ARCLA|nr:hypothetical protein L6452_09294 [Arctium lappa]
MEKTMMDHDQVRDPLMQQSIGDIVDPNVPTTKCLTVAAANLETSIKPPEKRGISAGFQFSSILTDKIY